MYLLGEICDKLALLEKKHLTPRLRLCISYDIVSTLIECVRRNINVPTTDLLFSLLGKFYQSNDFKNIAIDTWIAVFDVFIRDNDLDNTKKLLDKFPPMDALETIIRERYRINFNKDNSRCYRAIFCFISALSSTFKEGFSIFGSEFYIEIDDLDWLQKSFFYTESRFISHHNLAVAWNCSEEIYNFLMKYLNRLGVKNFYSLEFGQDRTGKFMSLFFKYLRVCSDHGVFINFMQELLVNITKNNDEKSCILLSHALKNENVILPLSKAAYLWNETILIELVQRMSEMIEIPLSWKIIFLKSFISQSYMRAFKFFLDILAQQPLRRNDFSSLAEYKLIPYIMKKQKISEPWFNALTEKFRSFCSLDCFTRYVSYSMIYKKPYCLFALFKIYSSELDEYFILIMKLIIESDLFDIYSYLLKKYKSQLEENASLLRSLCAIIYSLNKRSYLSEFKNYPLLFTTVKAMAQNEFVQFGHRIK